MLVVDCLLLIVGSCLVFVMCWVSVGVRWLLRVVYIGVYDVLLFVVLLFVVVGCRLACVVCCFVCGVCYLLFVCEVCVVC